MFLFCLFVVVVVCASLRACPLRQCLCPDVPVNGCKFILTESDISKASAYLFTNVVLIRQKEHVILFLCNNNNEIFLMCKPNQI